MVVHVSVDFESVQDDQCAPDHAQSPIASTQANSRARRILSQNDSTTHFLEDVCSTNWILKARGKVCKAQVVAWYNFELTHCHTQWKHHGLASSLAIP